MFSTVEMQLSLYMEHKQESLMKMESKRIPLKESTTHCFSKIGTFTY